MRQIQTFSGGLQSQKLPHAIVGVLASLLMVATSGCAIPCLRGPDPTPPLPGDFNGTTTEDNSAYLPIEEFFDEPLLTQLIVQGLSQNQELKIRNEEVQIAHNEILARSGAYLPFLSFGGGGGFMRSSHFTPEGAGEEQLLTPSGRRFPDPVPNLGLAGNFAWQIDYLRQLRNARDAAINRYWAAVESRDYLITQIVAEIAENYYELASLDQRLVYVDQTIALQERSLDLAEEQLKTGRGTELGVQRFLAEVRKNESQKLIIKQKIIEVENRMNFLAGRYPQFVERQAWDFIKLDSQALRVGFPSQLLENRRDIRAAEYEVSASGLDIKVAKADFFPKLVLTAGVGFEAFNPRYLFDPGAFVANAAGEVTAPLINKRAIQANYMNANARQLQAIYNYQRTVLNAYTEVINRITKVENYRNSVAIKQEQVQALEKSVEVVSDLFQAAREDVKYIDVLFAQRDLLEARTVLIETKQQQLSAIVNTYQALGGGVVIPLDRIYVDQIEWVPPEMIPVEVPAPQPQAPAPQVPAAPDNPAPPAAPENGN